MSDLTTSSAEVEAAIVTVLTTGGPVTVFGKSYTRANLDALRLVRDELELELVTNAIRTITTRGQDLSINGRRFTRANLGELRSLKAELERNIARRRRGGLSVTQAVPRG